MNGLLITIIKFLTAKELSLAKKSERDAEAAAFMLRQSNVANRRSIILGKVGRNLRELLDSLRDAEKDEHHQDSEGRK